MNEMQTNSPSSEQKKKDDLPIRLLTGAVYALILLVFFAGKIFVHKVVFDVLIVLFSVIGSYEMIRAFGDRLHKSQKIVAMVFSQLVVIVYIVADIIFTDVLGVALPGDNPMNAVGRNYAPHAALVVFILGIAVIFGLLVYGHERMSLESVGNTLIAYLYPSVFLVVMSVCNHFAVFSDAAIALVFVISPAADSFAYLFGRALGKKLPAKLAPHVSPKKTLIGGFGGLIGGAIGGVAVFFISGLTGCVDLTGVAQFTFQAPVFLWKELPFFIGMGILIAAFSQFGDLVESAFKRKLGIKDMGNILPGHGGVLDRIDSSLYASLIVAFIFAMRVMFWNFAA